MISLRASLHHLPCRLYGIDNREFDVSVPTDQEKANDPERHSARGSFHIVR